MLIDRSKTPSYKQLLDDTQSVLVDLLIDRARLVRDRNALVARPFFMLRRRLKTRVSEIDSNISILDEHIAKCRSFLVQGKKIVRGNSQEVRFYRYDGWTKKKLDLYVDGLVHDSAKTFGHDVDESYFFIDEQAKVAAQTLYYCEVAMIMRPSAPDLDGEEGEEETDAEYFCRILSSSKAFV